ncbi:MAG: hypothetical protein ACKVON_09910 [Beijerinckiaceae bacterium]
MEREKEIRKGGQDETGQLSDSGVKGEENGRHARFDLAHWHW